MAALINAPNLTSISTRADNPKPAPARFPVLKASPPRVIMIVSTCPAPGNRSFTISCAGFPRIVTIRQIFNCAPISSKMEIRMINPKLASN